MRFEVGNVAENTRILTRSIIATFWLQWKKAGLLPKKISEWFVVNALFGRGHDDEPRLHGSMTCPTVYNTLSYNSMLTIIRVFCLLEAARTTEWLRDMG